MNQHYKKVKLDHMEIGIHIFLEIYKHIGVTMCGIFSIDKKRY